MTKIIQAPTMDDALFALTREVAAREARGERTLVFCEDRLTLLAERAVLSANRATFCTEVSTFARFLKSDRRVISKQSSVMVLSALLARHKESLNCFGEGAAQAVYETIAQLFASGVTAEMLKEGAAQSEGLLTRKLLDLAFLMEEYGEFLTSRSLLDESGYLALLPSMLTPQAIGGAHIVFFAFPSFTRQALEGVRAAILNGASSTGIFLAGDEPFYTNEAARLFAAVAGELGEVQTVKLPCSLAGEAKTVQSALFSPDGGSVGAKSAHVTRFSAADEAEEMEKIAACIVRYAAEGRRYRDITVLVGSEDYFFAAEKAFAAYNIPYYADRKRALSEHPFCRFVISVLEGVSSGVLPESADDIASSVYFGEGGDGFRNYLARFANYRGGARREIVNREGVEQHYDALDKAQKHMKKILDLFKREDTAENFAENIQKLWELVDGERVTEQLKPDLTAEESAFLDTDRIFRFLGETRDVLGESKFGAREFAVLLKNGLDAVEVSLLPQHADAVFVGDITESRIYRSPILFCAGLSSEIPRVSQDTAVITDGDIRRLRDIQVEIEPAIAVVNARRREGLALNLCSFSEELFVSHPICRGGSEAEPSEVFDYLERPFRPQGEKSGLKELPDLFPYDCAAYGPALLAFFAGCERVEGVVAPPDTARAMEVNSSIRAALMRPEFGRGVDPDRMRDAAAKPDVSEAGDLYFAGTISPTLIETYHECPYKSFAMRGLKLSDREERGLFDAADAGSFIHAVLERASEQFDALESEEACAELARAVAAEELAAPRFSALADTAAGKYTGDRLVEDAARVSVQAYRQLKASNYKIVKREGRVSLPELGISGKVDRVDIAADGADEAKDCVRVIDYKSGGGDDSALAYYTGKKLQLQLYLLAETGEKRPAGAFYSRVADEYVSELDPRKKKRDPNDKFRMKGFFCNDPDILAGMDITREDGKKSDFFEGGGATQNGMPQEEFRDFLHYAKLVTENAKGEMRKGNIRPSPYDESCKYCKLQGACGFVGTPRKEPTLKCADIAAIARGGKIATAPAESEEEDA